MYVSQALLVELARARRLCGGQGASTSPAPSQLLFCSSGAVASAASAPAAAPKCGSRKAQQAAAAAAPSADAAWPAAALEDALRRTGAAPVPVRQAAAAAAAAAARAGADGAEAVRLVHVALEADSTFGAARRCRLFARFFFAPLHNAVRASCRAAVSLPPAVMSQLECEGCE